MKRVQFLQDVFCTQTQPLIPCFVHKYGHRDVMWKWSIHIVICSLLVGVYWVADKSKLEWKLSLTQFSPQDARNHILRLWNFKIFWGTTPPYPNKKGDKRALVDTVGFSIQSCWLCQFLLKPLRWSTYQILGYLYFIVELVHANQSKQKNLELWALPHHTSSLPNHT